MKSDKIKKYLEIYETAKDEFVNNNTSRYPQQAHEFALKVMEIELENVKNSFPRLDPID